MSNYRQLLLATVPGFAAAYFHKGWVNQRVVAAMLHDYAVVMIFGKDKDGKYYHFSTSSLYEEQHDDTLDFEYETTRDEANEFYSGVIACLKNGEKVDGIRIPIIYHVYDLKEDGLHEVSA